MEPYKLGEMEQKFADLIWEKEPVSSRELTRLCEEAFGWKRTTTYTMLKRLCVRGIFANEHGRVRALMTREDFLALGADTVITPELQEAVEGTDVTALSASMAGFTMMTEGVSGSITFGMTADGLAITGINY